jgi:hypothetical protein
MCQSSSPFVAGALKPRPKPSRVRVDALADLRAIKTQAQVAKKGAGFARVYDVKLVRRHKLTVGKT